MKCGQTDRWTNGQKQTNEQTELIFINFERNLAMNNTETWENLRNISCKKYTEFMKCCQMQGSQAMICYKSFSYFETNTPVIKGGGHNALLAR